MPLTGQVCKVDRQQVLGAREYCLGFRASSHRQQYQLQPRPGHPWLLPHEDRPAEELISPPFSTFRLLSFCFSLFFDFDFSFAGGAGAVAGEGGVPQCDECVAGTSSERTVKKADDRERPAAWLPNLRSDLRLLGGLTLQEFPAQRKCRRGQQNFYDVARNKFQHRELKRSHQWRLRHQRKPGPPAEHDYD